MCRLFPAAHDGRPRCGATELNHDDPSSFSPPAAFGPFRVLHQIGSGVLGPVFRTYEPERDRLIAVKAFRIDLLPEQSAALAKELQRIVDAGPADAGIVQPIAAGMEGHLPYLAQEYVAAESLDIAMKHYAPAAPARVMPFLRQVAGAVDAAAASGILHGGLHPRDVFLTTDEARTTGFGIVQAIENIGFRAPTRRPYTAPERMNGDEWGTAADIFSLGAIAHELLTGRRPAGPGDQDGTFSPDVPAEYRARLRDVLARALAEDPAARFASATAFVDAIEAASQGQRVESAPLATPAKAAAPLAGAAPLAAAPSLFDNDDAEADADPVPADEPVETIEEVETTDDIEDESDIDDEDDIEDESDIDDDEPIEPAEPTEPQVRDVWPPAGFATDDLDITSEKETDEGLADFDLDLNRSEPVIAAPISPTPHDEEAAIQGAAAFEYDTDAEDDENAPGPAAVAAAPLAAASVAATAPVVMREPVPAWRPSPAVTTQPVDARGGGGVRTIAGVIAGIAIGLLLGWFLFARDAAEDAAAPAGTQAQVTPQPPAQQQPDAAPSAPVTEVPVPPAAPADTPATPASEAAPAAPASGRVLVRSTPSNAMVVIDGVWSGRTPHTKRELSLGDHTVRVVLEGYEPINRRVRITAENPSHEMTFQLRRAAGRRGAQAPAPDRATEPPARTPAPLANSSLAISSRPAGARVTVDGRFVGTTPVKLDGLAAGRYQVRIELDGYLTWMQSVPVPRNQDARIAATLQQR